MTAKWEQPTRSHWRGNRFARGCARAAPEPSTAGCGRSLGGFDRRTGRCGSSCRPSSWRTGPDSFRRAARARLAPVPARHPPDPDRRRPGRAAHRRDRRDPGARREVEPAAAKEAANLNVALEPRYRFESFVVGKANEVAFNAARTLASAERSPSTRCSSMAAPAAARRTCCMRSAAAIHRLRPRSKIIYMSAEKFMVEFVAALRANETIQFKQLRLPADLLMIDDVQFIAGKIDPGSSSTHERDHRPAGGWRSARTGRRRTSTGSSRASFRG